MPDDIYFHIQFAVSQFCKLPDTASALTITKAFMEVRQEMHCLLDSAEGIEVIPYQPAGRLIEELCNTELAAYLQGDESALARLRTKTKRALRLLP